MSAGRTNAVQGSSLEQLHGQVQDVTVCYTQDGANYITVQVFGSKDIVALKGSSIFCAANNVRYSVSAVNANPIYGNYTAYWFGQVIDDNFFISAVG